MEATKVNKSLQNYKDLLLGNFFFLAHVRKQLLMSFSEEAGGKPPNLISEGCPLGGHPPKLLYYLY